MTASWPVLSRPGFSIPSKRSPYTRSEPFLLLSLPSRAKRSLPARVANILTSSTSSQTVDTETCRGHNPMIISECENLTWPGEEKKEIRTLTVRWRQSLAEMVRKGGVSPAFCIPRRMQVNEDGVGVLARGVADGGKTRTATGFTIFMCALQRIRNRLRN